MTKRKVISYKNLPAKIPVVSPVVAYLLLDKLNASGWIYGVAGTFFVLLFIACISSKITQE